ncbi:S8 family serine peptidase [Candidatus Pacearchaeota archaeon]|nr:S8 family serine peptidase [Candidatus Pacearchaeota archaeon]
MKKGVERSFNKMNAAWRYISLAIVLVVLGVFAVNLGKPILTAFVISEADYNAQVDNAVISDVQDDGSARVIVKIKDEAGIKGMVLDDISDVRQELGEEKVNYVSDSDKVLSADINSQDLEALKNNPSVLEIKKVKEVSLFLQDSIAITNASSAWNYQANTTSGLTNITGAGQTICIIDTGVNFSHNDLANKNALTGSSGANIDCINADCIANSSVSDDHGHGTFVAGISAASGSIFGVAKDAKLVGVKILNAQGAGYEDDLKLGMEWCMDNSAAYNISVISLSLGTSTLYTNACDNVDDDLNITSSVNRAVSNNIAVVAATGNQGSATGIASPACITNSTAVGAVDKSDSMLFNRNPQTDLLAPGSSINSTTLSGGYTSLSGTSMSTPHVSGAFALLQQFYYLQNSTQASVSLIENALKNTGKAINDSSSGIIFRRINIYSALLSLSGVTSGAPGNATNETNQTNQTSPGNQTGNETNQTMPPHYITLSLNTPQSNAYLRRASSSQTFSCSASTNYTIYNESTNNTTNASLTMARLLVWNNTGSLVYNDSYDASAINSSSLTANFTYNVSLLSSLSSDYSWGCEAGDSHNNLGSSVNNSVFYDINTPTISLIEPASGASNTTSNVIRFYFSADDNFGVDVCNLTRNGQNMGVKGGINNVSNFFIYTLIDNGQHSWSVTCFDRAGNSNTSETRLLSLNYPGNNAATPSPPSNNTGQPGGQPGAGGGGGSEEGGEEYAPSKYVLTADETYAGRTFNAGAGDEIKFIINKDGQNRENTLSIDALGLHTVRLLFVEKSMFQTLIEGEGKNFALEYSDKEDLSINAGNISAGKVDLMLKSLIAPPAAAVQESPNETLNATETISATPTTGSAVKEEDLTALSNESEAGTTGRLSGLSGFVVGLKENTTYLIALITLLAITAAYFVFRKIRAGRMISGQQKTEKGAGKKE